MILQIFNHAFSLQDFLCYRIISCIGFSFQYGGNPTGPSSDHNHISIGSDKEKLIFLFESFQWSHCY